MLIEILKQMYITKTMDIDIQNITTDRICKQYINHLHLANIVNAIVNAAEREGGIHKINLCGSKNRFRDSVQNGFLWYNANCGSTKVVKI